MKDHFGEFIMPSGRRGFAGVSRGTLGNTPTVTAEQKTPLKTHLLWGLLAGGTGYACWKISEWRTSLRLLEQQTKSR